MRPREERPAAKPLHYRPGGGTAKPYGQCNADLLLEQKTARFPNNRRSTFCIENQMSPESERDIEYLADFIPCSPDLSEGQKRHFKVVLDLFPTAKLAWRISHKKALFYYGFDPKIGVFSGPLFEE